MTAPAVNQYWRSLRTSDVWRITEIREGDVLLRDPENVRPPMWASFTEFSKGAEHVVVKDGQLVPDRPTIPAFAPGDVVVLRSGGMRMTVHAAGETTAACTWHDEDGHRQSDCFPTCTLRWFDESEWAQR